MNLVEAIIKNKPITPKPFIASWQLMQLMKHKELKKKFPDNKKRNEAIKEIVRIGD